jgi:hypothetical protein
VPVVAIPLPGPVFLVHHDRVYIIDGTEVFPGPLEVIQRLVRGVPGIEAAALPLADHLLQLNRLKLVIDGRNRGLIDMALDLGEVGELLLCSDFPATLKPSS